VDDSLSGYESTGESLLLLRENLHAAHNVGLLLLSHRQRDASHLGDSLVSGTLERSCYISSFWIAVSPGNVQEDSDRGCGITP
jgi:hypothetical protein